MAKIVLKRKKSDKDTYLVRNVKSAYGELEYDDSLLEEDQVVEPSILFSTLNTAIGEPALLSLSS